MSFKWPNVALSTGLKTSQCVAMSCHVLGLERDETGLMPEAEISQIFTFMSLAPSTQLHHKHVLSRNVCFSGSSLEAPPESILCRRKLNSRQLLNLRSQTLLKHLPRGLKIHRPTRQRVEQSSISEENLGPCFAALGKLFCYAMLEQVTGWGGSSLCARKLHT